MPRLRHLDERPVFDDERAGAEAFATGGRAAEKAARKAFREAELAKDRDQRKRFKEWQVNTTHNHTHAQP